MALLDRVSVSRRQLLAGIPATAATSFMGGMAIAPATAKAPVLGTQAPPYYRFKLGSIEATVVSDGPLSIGDPARTFRGQSPGESAESVADMEWWRVFQDETLQQLIRSALAENYDLRVAAARILDARAQVTITRSFQFPELNAGGSAPYQHIQGERSVLQSKDQFSP